jgi:hypothetical protein
MVAYVNLYQSPKHTNSINDLLLLDKNSIMSTR